MSNKDWITWLNEPIYTDAGIHNIQKRKYAIYIFLTEGILPFIQSSGYRFRHDTKVMTRLLLSALYFYSTDFKMPIYRHSIPNLKDHEVEFYDALDTIAWSRFWEKWGSFQDFDIDSSTYRFRFVLPTLLWSWIDLDTSPRVLHLAKIIEIVEMHEEGTKGRDDLYLLETARHDYQDRHWH